jgi:PAS domain S-box-containing protein
MSTGNWDAVTELGVDMVFRIDADGTVLEVSAGVEELLGEPPSSVVGESFDAFVPTESRAEALRSFQRVLDGEPVREVTFPLQGEEEIRWAELSADPVREAGEVVAVRGAAREVTDRRRRRRALEQRSAAMESAIDGMAVLDEDGSYVYLNEAHADLYGYEREELLGRSWECLYDPAERERLAEEVLPAMEREGSWRGESVGRRHDGSTVQQELALAPLDDGGLVCVVRDVTERHRREGIVAVLDRVLRHNLRNEMNVVLGEAGVIERRAEGRVADAAARIRTTARDLLETSETARDIRQVVSDDGPSGVAELNEAVHRGRRCLDETEPCDLHVDGTDRQLRVPNRGVDVVIRELLDNAVEHAGPNPDVLVELEQVGGPSGTAVLRVLDDGPGLPSMERQVLAESQETPLQHGQGLGLWIVNWIVTEAGGELVVGDRDPTGTEIEVRLPLVQPDAGDQKTGAAPESPPESLDD